ncbi:putative serine/threonine-protein kinase WNK2 [Porphyridium purpureum]|uniref:Putative serine/threonine-protein kinase WNK2 n=1 Tax=Porphyridium purpureum TaxID=35688 RepID=A0A5J4Z5H4_PORPP|nr:putative serine/threonine-protein kinase WNK2 [Porphyridium purpureum]|eukprot:POR1107..scf295_1
MADGQETDPTGRFTRTNEMLGRGAYKYVYKAFDNQEALEVAWNKLDIDRLSKLELSKVSKEVELLEKVNHKNIISFFGSWRTVDPQTGAQSMNFITELMMSGTLKEYVRKAKAIKLKVLRRWGCNILEAIDYLHSQNPPIIHRDLKCDNIFINGHVGEVKLGDLGLSTQTDAERAFTVIGTPEFMAPELYEESYTESVDVYAFGMCMLEMLTMEYPYMECQNPAQIFRKVFQGEKPKSFNRLKKGEFKSVIGACLEREKNRPTARQLLNTPIFRDWETDPGTLSNIHLLMDTPLPEGLSTDLLYPSRAASQPSSPPNSVPQSLTPAAAALLEEETRRRRTVGNGEIDLLVKQLASMVSEITLTVHIPVDNAMKLIEFSFNPHTDEIDTITRELVHEFGLNESYHDIIRNEIHGQVMKSVQNESVSLVDSHDSAAPALSPVPPLIERGDRLASDSPGGRTSPTESPDGRYSELYSFCADPSTSLKQTEWQPSGKEYVMHPSNLASHVDGGQNSHEVAWPGPSDQDAMLIKSQSERDPKPRVSSDDEQASYFGSSVSVPQSFVGRGPLSARSSQYGESPVPAAGATRVAEHSNIPVVVVSSATPLRPSQVLPGGRDTFGGLSSSFVSESDRVGMAMSPASQLLEVEASEQSEKSISAEQRQATQFKSNMLLLSYACRGRLQAIKTRLKYGADVLFADYDRRTALHLACAEGHLSIVELLVEHGAEPEASDRWGTTPIDEAKKNNHVDVLNFFREQGFLDDDDVSDVGTVESASDVNLRQRDDSVPEVLSASRAQVLGMELLEFSARGMFDLVRERLMAGARATFSDYDKRTALHLAASEGHADVAELLLINGADLYAEDRFGQTPIQDGLKNGHLEVLEVFRRAGVVMPSVLGPLACRSGDPAEMANKLGLELIQQAAKGRRQAVAGLLEHGVDPQFADYDKRTALHLAAAEGWLEICQLLVERGAQVSAQDRYGANALDEAVRASHTTIIEFLTPWMQPKADPAIEHVPTDEGSADMVASQEHSTLNAIEPPADEFEAAAAAAAAVAAAAASASKPNENSVAGVESGFDHDFGDEQFVSAGTYCSLDSSMRMALLRGSSAAAKPRLTEIEKTLDESSDDVGEYEEETENNADDDEVDGSSALGSSPDVLKR